MKIQACGLALLLLCTPSAHASGNRLIAQSIAATALAGSTVAQLTGPDAAYWNPANLTDLESDTHSLEASLIYTHVPEQEYDDNRSAMYDGRSEELDSLRPTLHYASEDLRGWRVGLSLTQPFGLSREWNDPFPATFAKKYSLSTQELSPSLAYALSKFISVGGGPRLVYGEAEVEGRGVLPGGGGMMQMSRKMEGDATGFGYNLALTVKPLQGLRLGLTYRSKVELDLEGDADLSVATAAGTASYSGTGSVEYPLPAVLALGVAYTMGKTTVELDWDRTYWSDYQSLDFQYEGSLGHPLLQALFDDPIEKNWQDTDAFRVGISYLFSDSLTLMAGIAHDKNPVPDASLLFDLPDSDMMLYSLGATWRISDSTQLGLAYMYSDKKDREVRNAWLDGEFSGGRSHVVSVGVLYRF